MRPFVITRITIDACAYDTRDADWMRRVAFRTHARYCERMEFAGIVVGAVVGAAVFLTALYYVVKGAIRNALAEHTTRATWGVSVVNFPKAER